MKVPSLYRPDQWDVVVVGGGIVGAVFTALLGSNTTTSPLRVALLERKPPELRSASAPAVRVSAIAARTQRAFQQIGAWDDLKAESCPYRKMVVWDSLIDGARIQFNQESKEDFLGHIIPNDVSAQLSSRKLAKLAVRRCNRFYSNVSRSSATALESVYSLEPRSDRSRSRMRTSPNGLASNATTARRFMQGW